MMSEWARRWNQSSTSSSGTWLPSKILMPRALTGSSDAMFILSLQILNKDRERASTISTDAMFIRSLPILNKVRGRESVVICQIIWRFCILNSRPLTMSCISSQFFLGLTPFSHDGRPRRRNSHIGGQYRFHVRRRIYHLLLHRSPTTEAFSAHPDLEFSCRRYVEWLYSSPKSLLFKL